MLCRQCGFQINDNDKFCPRCGAEVPVSNNSSQIDSCTSCPFCGNQVRIDEQYCGTCGNKLNYGGESAKNTGKKSNGKRNVIIVAASVALLLLVVAVILCAQFFTGDFGKANSSSDSVISADTKENVGTLISASDYLRSEIIPKYIKRDNADGEITLSYKYVDGKKVFDKENIDNAILQYGICDINGDSTDDIFTVVLDGYENSNGEGRGFSCNYVIYIADGFGSYVPYCVDGINLLTVVDNTDIKNFFSMFSYDDSKYGFLVIKSCSKNITENDDLYYPESESLGDFTTDLAVLTYSDKIGINQELCTFRSVGHIMGMPEAESLYYAMKINDGEFEILFDGGINEVTTGDNYPTPYLKETIDGTCKSETEACEKINDQLSKFNLSEFAFSPFDWKTREDNPSQSVKKESNSSLLEISFTDNGDHSKGSCTVKFLK